MPSPAPQAVGDEPDHTLQGSEMKGGAMKIQHGLLIAGSLLLAAGCSNDAAAPAPAETAQADTAAVETEVRNFIEQYNADYRSEEHTSELQTLMRISYDVFCLKKKNQYPNT